jgi:hypothetical protein
LATQNKIRIFKYNKKIRVMFEEKLIKQVRGGLLGMKMGTKSPKEVLDRLTLLKKYNPFMFEDLYLKYIELTK